VHILHTHPLLGGSLTTRTAIAQESHTRHLAKYLRALTAEPGAVGFAFADNATRLNISCRASGLQQHCAFAAYWSTTSELPSTVTRWTPHTAGRPERRGVDRETEGPALWLVLSDVGLLTA
jgi:hypothetical protein